MPKSEDLWFKEPSRRIYIYILFIFILSQNHSTGCLGREVCKGQGLLVELQGETQHGSGEDTRLLIGQRLVDTRGVSAHVGLEQQQTPAADRFGSSATL